MQRLKVKEVLKPSVSNGVFCILFVAVDKKHAAGGKQETTAGKSGPSEARPLHKTLWKESYPEERGLCSPFSSGKKNSACFLLLGRISWGQVNKRTERPAPCASAAESGEKPGELVTVMPAETG